jgi:hypothetical protein
VLVKQNFGSYAKALLERQAYPDLKEYPGGPPKRPYDVTAHTLPLLFGVEVATVMGSAPATGAPIAAIAEPRYSVAGLSESRARRVAIYRSYTESMDEGWTRWIFDSNRIPFTSVVDRDIKAGNLNARFDAIIIPDQSVAAITRGLPSAYPDSVRGGLGEVGVKAIVDFVEQGGTLLTFNDASLFAIEAMKLPVKNVLEGVKNTDFYAPGSILAAEMKQGHPSTRGVTAPVLGVWFEDSPAFEITDPSKATAVLTYPASGNPLLSGWLLGGQKLNGKAAMVEATVGKGKVVLYGFRPQYRGQTNATYPLIWDAIGRAATQ